MFSLVMLLAALIVPFAGQDQAHAKPSFPKNSGVYAMTSQGAVELKISGEPARVALSNRTTVHYRPGSFEKLPVIEVLQGFYINMMSWGPRDLYLVVGRDQLENPSDRYVRLKGRAVRQGLTAFTVVADELASPTFLIESVRRLTPSGKIDDSTEAYLVLELQNSEGLSDRAYPVRLKIAR